MHEKNTVAITIILICLALQRWWSIDQVPRYTHWFDYYYHWLTNRFGAAAWWRGGLGVAAIILPAWIIYILIAFISYHLLSIVGYYLLALIVFWYVVNTKAFTLENASQRTFQQLFDDAYQQMFSLIFWLLVLGSIGVVLYTLVIYLCKLLEDLPDDHPGRQLLGAAYQWRDVLDWLPLRLLGLTYALVGHFSPTFSIWYKNLFVPLAQERQQTARCGLTALGWSVDPQQTLSAEEIVGLESLMNRTLWVWLVVIAVFTIGRWLG